MAAQPGAPSVPQLLHGVPGGCTHAGSPHQEGPAGSPQDGGQFSSVSQAGAGATSLVWHLPKPWGSVLRNGGAPCLFPGPTLGSNRFPLLWNSPMFSRSAVCEFDPVPFKPTGHKLFSLASSLRVSSGL